MLALCGEPRRPAQPPPQNPAVSQRVQPGIRHSVWHGPALRSTLGHSEVLFPGFNSYRYSTIRTLYTPGFLPPEGVIARPGMRGRHRRGRRRRTRWRRELVGLGPVRRLVTPLRGRRLAASLGALVDGRTRRGRIIDGRRRHLLHAVVVGTICRVAHRPCRVRVRRVHRADLSPAHEPLRSVLVSPAQVDRERRAGTSPCGRQAASALSSGAASRAGSPGEGTSRSLTRFPEKQTTSR